MNALRFRFAGFPVEVAPNVGILAGIFFLLGLSWQWSLPLILAIIVVALVSILIHELGHATLARAYGLEPIDITLHGMGGLTRHRPSNSPLKELIIILAGPFFGVLLAVAGFVVLLAPLPGFAADVMWWLVFLNILWSLFNMLPIFPLDGGQALSALLQLFLAPRVAWPLVWGLGLALSVALAVVALYAGEIFILFFAGLFAWRNLQMLQAWRKRDA